MISKMKSQKRQKDPNIYASKFSRVSGIPLTGLHLRQALDILRTSPPLTLLQVVELQAIDNSACLCLARYQELSDTYNI